LAAQINTVSGIQELNLTLKAWPRNDSSGPLRAPLAIGRSARR
jgi:hypothetical protein